MTKMSEKEMLERLRIGVKHYNENRLARDFQKEEIEKFVQWMYAQYGMIYKDVNDAPNK